MSGNITNGGLAVKWQGGIVFALPNEWFLNSDDEYIYYSNRDDENRLYRKHNVNDKGKLILGKPCSGVVLFSDSLYFVNESDRKVYRCSKDGKNVIACSKSETYEFTVLSDGTVYTNPHAKRLCAYENSVFFADGGNSGNIFALTKVIPRTNETEVFPSVTPSYINVHLGYVYYTDRTQNNKIFRFDPATNTKMSVFGGSAEYLHIIDDWLYFLVDKKWKRLSLLNFGEAQDI
ncbi:MAG: DUF5050 domain-containing protein [Oscillospiraceae bacterium]|nr:DUF5050 domain-containing protein [Oscillospiraceae bacterium]